MEYRTVGASDLIVSAVGLGCNNFGARLDLRATKAVVEASLEAGINFFDTADVYGGGHSEEFLGQALSGRRQEAVIATKFGLQAIDDHGRTSSAAVTLACERSLRRLQTDWIDLYYLHSPDESTPEEETFGALADLVRQGNVRYVATANHSPEQVAHTDQVTRSRGFARPIAAQLEWSLLERSIEGEAISACRRLGLGVIPYYPLGAGLLTGKYRAHQPPPEGARLTGTHFIELARRGLAPAASPENLAKVERLLEVAGARGMTLLELAISWLAAQESVPSVIAGAMSMEQVRMNAGAIRPLFKEDLRAVDEALSAAAADASRQDRRRLTDVEDRCEQ